MPVLDAVKIVVCSALIMFLLSIMMVLLQNFPTRKFEIAI